MPLHFAYGANMDVAAMAARCPGSRPLGLARLPGHRRLAMPEGFLSVRPDPRRSVGGLLWQLSLADVPALDRYEEVGSGLYAKRLLPVRAAGAARRALVYVGRESGPGRLPAPYHDAVLRAARAAGLPADDLEEIATLGEGRPERGGQEDAATRVAATARPAVRSRYATPYEAPAPDVPAGWRWIT